MHSDGTVDIDGEDVRPAPTARKSALPNRGLVPLGAAPPFTAIFHHEWEFVQGKSVKDGGEWLPKISEARHVPGANGTRVPLRGDPRTLTMDVNPMLAGIMSKRSIVIREENPQLGSEYMHYLRKYNTESGAPFYCYRWTKAKLSNNGRDPYFVLDQAKMVGFRRRVFEAGIVPPMNRHALESEILVLTNRIARWDEKVESNQMDRQAYNEKSAAAHKEIAAMRAAWERDFGRYDSEGGIDVEPEGADEIEIDPPAKRPRKAAAG